jgi:putative oxidoreductase
MRFGIAILRAVIGGLFSGHGMQKLTGAFGGHGLEGTAGFFESLGLHPGKHHASAAGLAETGGGALLISGAATPAAAAALTGTMSVAVLKVHGQNGPWAQNGGYAYPLVLVAALFAITASGPGDPSLDSRVWGVPWALAELAAGVAGGFLAVKYGEMNAPAAEPEPAGEAAPSPEPATA